MSFAENLKLVRKERNITQEELAEMLSVSRQAVSKWESGFGYPETEKLLILAKELDVSLDYLLLDEAVLREKEKTDEKVIVRAPIGKIAIPTYDKQKVVVCHAVKSSKVAFAGKNEPKYLLAGVDKVTFWGENTTVLGWYKSLDDINREITEITEALNVGQGTYELKYAADVEIKGLFGGNIKLKEE